MKILSNLNRLNIGLYYILWCKSNTFILVFNLVYMSLLVLMSLVGWFLWMLVIEVSDVSIVDSAVDEAYIGCNVDVIGITDMSYITDTTDILDFVDYISFVDNMDMNEERYWLHHYFDNFIKLFRKDGGITIKPIYCVEYNSSKENFNVEHKSVSIYKEVLSYEVLRLNELCEYNVKKACKFGEDLAVTERWIDIYRDDIRELEVENKSLDEDLDNLRRECDIKNIEYNELREFTSHLSGDYIRLSGNLHILQTENEGNKCTINSLNEEYNKDITRLDKDVVRLKQDVVKLNKHVFILNKYISLLKEENQWARDYLCERDKNKYSSMYI